MMLGKWSKMFAVAVVVVAPSAFAAEPVKLNCPTGTQQARSGGKQADIVACVKVEGARKGFRPHGPTVYLYPNGTKQAEGSSEDGFRTGLWTLYDEQGHKTGTAMFKRSNFHGEVVEFHANGKVRKVENYSQGLRHGTAKEFSEDGKLVKQTEYRDNREVASK